MERRTPKRGKPNLSSSLAKRLRLPSAGGGEADQQATADQISSSAPPSAVMVTGLPFDCTVLELKSLFELYGPISRIRIDVNCYGYVTFRSDQSAEAAIAASVDPTFGIAIGSSKLLVVRASDPLTHWRIGIRTSSTSKLVRAEKSLSRLGRSKKPIVPGILEARQEFTHTEREIRAYDDLY